MERSLNAASIKDSQSFGVFGVMGVILEDNRLVSSLGPDDDAIDSAVSTAADSAVVLVGVLADNAVESLSLFPFEVVVPLAKKELEQFENKLFNSSTVRVCN